MMAHATKPEVKRGGWPASRKVLLVVLVLILALVPVAVIGYQVKKHQLESAGTPELAQEEAEAEQKFSTRATEEQRKQVVIDLFAASGSCINLLRFTCEEVVEDGDWMRLYEAEVEFLNDCLLKEGRAAHWWPDYHPGPPPKGRGPKRGKPRLTQFMEGERWVVHGIIDIDGPQEEPHAPQRMDSIGASP